MQRCVAAAHRAAVRRSRPRRGRTVADVLADPTAFESETLPDPLEGIEYGRCKAKIMRRDYGTPWIHSFAHSRAVYELLLDAVSIRAAIAAADADDMVPVLIDMLLRASVEPPTMKRSSPVRRSARGSAIDPAERTIREVMRIKPPGFIIPAQSVMAARPPSGADWVHEIQRDGYRMIVQRDGPPVRLLKPQRV
jgi:hypothetical protein